MVTRGHAIRVDRLGHLALDVDVYLCERDAGLHDGHDDLFWLTGQPCNPALVNQWRRHLTIVDQPRPDLPAVPWVEGQDRHDLLERTPSHITFTEEEQARGRAMLAHLGIRGSHVTFHNRDSAFLNETQPGGDWSYHDYRDVPIGDFVSCAAEMVRRGHSAVRVGSVVAEQLRQYVGRGIVDYTDRRTDFADVFLAATCRFHIGVSSGPITLAAIFRRPTVIVDAAPFLTALKPPIPYVRLFIPKLYRRAGRTLTVKEIVTEGLDRLHCTDEFAAAGVQLERNLPHEISGVAREMDDRLADRWQPHPDDDHLQAAFWDAADLSMGRARVGAEWLRGHAEELGL